MILSTAALATAALPSPFNQIIATDGTVDNGLKTAFVTSAPQRTPLVNRTAIRGTVKVRTVAVGIAGYVIRPLLVECHDSLANLLASERKHIGATESTAGFKFRKTVTECILLRIVLQTVKAPPDQHHAFAGNSKNPPFFLFIERTACMANRVFPPLIVRRIHVYL